MELYAPPGTESYYTLDGSDPDENAYLYTEPIFIEDVTPQENVHAMRTDTSYFAEAVILDSGGNDRFSKMRDVLVSWLAKDRAFSTMRFKLYAMFLNGEYWGVYWITEKYDPAYLAHY